MPRECTVQFLVREIDIRFQRNKTDDPDRDFVVLHVAGTQNVGDSKTTGPVSIGTPSSGAVITDPTPPIETEAITLGEDDQAVINCQIYNQSKKDNSNALADILKISGAVAAVIGGGFELQNKLKALSAGQLLEGQIIGGVGLVAALFGELLSDWGEVLGLKEPDCDGVVFDNSLSLLIISGAKLMDKFQDLQKSQGLKTHEAFDIAELIDRSQVTPHECGHNPETRVVFQARITGLRETDVHGPTFNDTTTPAGPASKFHAVVQPIPLAWVNNWGETSNLDTSQIICRVEQATTSAPTRPNTSATTSLRAALDVCDAAKELVGQSSTQVGRLRSTVVPPSIMAATANGDSAVATALAAAQLLSISIEERGGVAPEHLAQTSTICRVPMVASPFVKPIHPLNLGDLAHHVHELIQVHVPDTAPANKNPQLLFSDIEGILKKHLIVPIEANNSHFASSLTLSFADTAVLSNGATFQLYTATDDQDRPAGFRLRYTRPASTNATAVDVMLEPAQRTPA